MSNERFVFDYELSEEVMRVLWNVREQLQTGTIAVNQKDRVIRAFDSLIETMDSNVSAVVSSFAKIGSHIHGPN